MCEVFPLKVVGGDFMWFCGNDFWTKVTGPCCKANYYSFFRSRRCKASRNPQAINYIIQEREFQELECLLSTGNSWRVMSTSRKRAMNAKSAPASQTTTFVVFNKFSYENENWIACICMSVSGLNFRKSETRFWITLSSHMKYVHPWN